MRICEVGSGSRTAAAVELRALALVDGHRVDAVDRGQAGRAELDELAAPLEGRAHATGVGGHDDPGVAVVEAQAVVVLGHEQRPADVPLALGAEALDLVGQPALDAVGPGGDAVGARGGARTGRGSFRAPRGPGARRPSRAASITARAAPTAPSWTGASAESVSGSTGSQVTSSGERRERLHRRVGVAAPDGLGHGADGAAEAVHAAEDDDAGAGRPVVGRADDVPEHGAGLDRRQLPGVADEDQARLRAHRLEQPGHLRERDHRGLVDDHDVVGQPVAAMVAEAALAVGAPAEQAVQGRGARLAQLRADGVARRRAPRRRRGRPPPGAPRRRPWAPRAR